MARRLALVAVAAALAVAAPVQAKTLVRYSMTGGLAGLSHTVVVGTSGSGRTEDGRDGAERRFRLSHRELRALEHALAAARFATLSRRYAPDATVNDGVTEAVGYRGRTVTVETGAHPPERLNRLLRRLRRLG